MKSLAKSVQDQALQTYKSILTRMEGVLDACRNLVGLIDKHPELRGFLVSRGMSEGFLDLVERAGRGQMDSRLLFLPGHGPERLMRAPLQVQERLLNTGVEIVRLVGDEIRREVKSVAELSRSEAEIALNSSGNVPVDEQTDLLKERILNKAFASPPVRLVGDELYVRKDTRIPFQDLERLFASAKAANDEKKHRLESDIKRRQIAKD